MAKKILIIDDDPVILRYLEALFQDNGYETVLATSSMEGLELVQNAAGKGDPYSVAFVDMRMPPGWDGLETTLRIADRVGTDLQIYAE